MNQYEGMFLFDPTFASSFESCEKEIHRLMERAQAQIIFCRKWDERRLAYKIKGQKRGVYVLVYFTAAPTRSHHSSADVQLSEDILRLLVIRADGLTREQMERTVPSGAEEPTKTGDDAGKSAEPSTTTEIEKERDENTKMGKDTGPEEGTESVPTETTVDKPLEQAMSEDE